MMAGGRPKLSLRTKRDRVVHVRLSEGELSALTSFATSHNLTTSEVLRRLVRQASGFGPTFDGDAAKGIRANVVQLRKAGVNLNQITRALNSGRAPGYADLTGGVERLARIVAGQIDMLEGLCARARERASQKVVRDV
ncbi:plasmid mobilization relaxosome protein MobC [Rhizobium sp. C4]|uniref:plasmid mobilization relaxosome protein MobC n=1 Tax=Rhizobium sp. C4 TaxID=1349800 RepID=UPI001E2D2D28|nr:plasmid mobilization relaxosome protein MobC [Rhizobium sp. C4]MCD2174923.1 MobC family plasmid mobilization relaxosome protein [Rhizobium sp. C4]